MKLSDLFVDYYEIEGLRIVRVLDFDIFFAVRKGEKETDPIMVQFLREHEVEGLKNNTMSVEKLDQYIWKTLEECEHALPEKVYRVAAEASRSRGFFENNRELEIKINAEIEKDKKARDEKIRAIGRKLKRTIGIEKKENREREGEDR